MRPTAEDAMIRQRMIDIVLSIRPMPPSVRPSEEFVHETRDMLLGRVRPISLSARRRERLLARLEDFTKKKRAS